MEHSAEKPRSRWSGRGSWLVVILVATVLAGLFLVYYFVPDHYWGRISAIGIVFFVSMPSFFLTLASYRESSDNAEAQARHRVRQAEDKLADSLRSWNTITISEPDADHSAAIRDVLVLPENARQLDIDELPAKERKDDRLTLAALWDVTHGRMDLYHQIVTAQARRSFIAAQAAMGIGFVLLVGFAVLAAEAKTTTAAISAGGLGAVGAAFAAYIGKTFIRSQESAASHLRAYFDQPLELSRYLAAERLLGDAADLTADQRAAMVSSLVQSIATAGQLDGKPTGRQSRGRASR